MSRSYKKTPVAKVQSNGSRKYCKRQANKKVRKTHNIGNKSNAYRKVYESWNICGYRFYEERNINMDAEEIYKWKKEFHMK